MDKVVVGRRELFRVVAGVVAAAAVGLSARAEVGEWVAWEVASLYETEELPEKFLDVARFTLKRAMRDGGFREARNMISRVDWRPEWGAWQHYFSVELR